MDLKKIGLIHFATLFFTTFVSFRKFGYPSPLFLVWLLPIPIYWLKSDLPYKSSSLLLFGAILLALLGIILELNILKDIGQAMSLASFLPLNGFTLFWLLGSFFYLPSSGWLLNKVNLRYDGIKWLGLLIFESPLLFRLWTKK